MGPETWQTVGTIVVLLAVGGYNGWRSHKAEQAAASAGKSAATAAAQATTAAVQTVSTGNGFAGDVRRQLDRIEARIERVDGAVLAHLEDHAGSDLRRRPLPSTPPRGDNA